MLKVTGRGGIPYAENQFGPIWTIMKHFRIESVQRDTEFLAFKTTNIAKKTLRAYEDTKIEVINIAINLV